MINANELRIGNWSTKNGNEFKIDGFGIYRVSYGELILDPIPITPEILKKCGFEYEDMGDDSPYERWICKMYKQLWVWDFNGEEWMFCLGDGFEQGGYHFFHQLQNFYFALTGTELIYKP